MQLVILRDNSTATGKMSLGEISNNQQQKPADSHSYTGIYHTQVLTNKALFDSRTIYSTIQSGRLVASSVLNCHSATVYGTGVSSTAAQAVGDSDVLNYRQWQQGLLLKLHPR